MENYDFSIHGERPNVNHFLNKYCKQYTIFKDQDTGEMRAKSPFDFSLARNAKVIYIEAKWSHGRLTQYQKLFMFECIRTKTPWGLLRWNNGKIILEWKIGSACGELTGLDEILDFIDKLTKIE